MNYRYFKWTALWVATLSVPLLNTGISVGQEIHVVSPGALQDTDGNLSTPTPTVPFRLQWLYPASDFGFIPEGGAFIVGHSIRADKNQLTEITNTFANSVFTLSTTSLNSLTANFNDNLGGDARVVFDGSTSISYAVSGPPSGPNPFGGDVEYQTPFLYDPSLGNLLVQQVTTSGNDVPDSLKDWQTTVNAQFVSNIDPNSLTGQQQNRVIVTRFTIVPEPTTVALILFGTCAATIFIRNRRCCWTNQIRNGRLSA